MGEGLIIAAMMLLSAAVTPDSLSAPVPYHLTAECKAKTVKATNGNYFYDTFEHCKQKK